MLIVLYSLFYRYKNHTKVELDEEKKKIKRLLVNDNLKEYEKLKDFPNILLKKIQEEDRDLYFKIFDQNRLPSSIYVSEFENKLILWCTDSFDKKYNRLLEDSKNKNEIEEVKHVDKVVKKEKERSSINNYIESMYCILRNKVFCMVLSIIICNMKIDKDLGIVHIANL